MTDDKLERIRDRFDQWDRHRPEEPIDPLERTPPPAEANDHDGG